MERIILGKGVGRRAVIGKLRRISRPIADTTERFIFICDAEKPLDATQKSASLGVICKRDFCVASTPALYVDSVDIDDGQRAILDPVRGRLTVDPTLETLEEFSRRVKLQDEEDEALRELVGIPTVSPSGRRIKLYERICDANLRPFSDSDGVFSDTLIPHSKEVLLLCRYDDAEKLRDASIAASCSELSVVFSGVRFPEELRRAKSLICEVRNALRYEDVAYGELKRVGVLLDSPVAVLLSEIFDADFCLVDTDRAVGVDPAIEGESAEEALWRLLRPVSFKCLGAMGHLALKVEADFYVVDDILYARHCIRNATQNFCVALNEKERLL